MWVRAGGEVENKGNAIATQRSVAFIATTIRSRSEVQLVLLLAATWPTLASPVVRLLSSCAVACNAVEAHRYAQVSLPFVLLCIAGNAYMPALLDERVGCLSPLHSYADTSIQVINEPSVLLGSAFRARLCIPAHPLRTRETPTPRDSEESRKRPT